MEILSLYLQHTILLVGDVTTDYIEVTEQINCSPENIKQLQQQTSEKTKFTSHEQHQSQIRYQ